MTKEKEQPQPYNRPADTAPMSDIVNPRFKERFGELADAINATNDSHIINPYAEPSSVMWVNDDDSLQFQFVKKKPNWWWRMWQFLLLGWRWENV